MTEDKKLSASTIQWTDRQRTVITIEKSRYRKGKQGFGGPEQVWVLVGNITLDHKDGKESSLALGSEL